MEKKSNIVPVPKCKVTNNLNDLRPVALMSLIMKCFEKKIVKELILQKTETRLDPLQFAHREGRGVEDVILYLLNLVYKHLEKPKTCARLLFINFYSAFNTIKPHLLIDKIISQFNIDLNVAGWTLEKQKQNRKATVCNSQQSIF